MVQDATVVDRESESQGLPRIYCTNGVMEAPGRKKRHREGVADCVKVSSSG